MAVSGSHASEWLAGSTNYVAAITSFLAFIKANREKNPRLLIYLGTNDATAASDTSGTYLANMRTIIANCRTDLQLPDMPCDFAILPVGVGAGKDPILWANIRAYQAILNGTLGALGVQMSEGPYSDGLHFNGVGSLDCAMRISSAL